MFSRSMMAAFLVVSFSGLALGAIGAKRFMALNADDEIVAETPTYKRERPPTSANARWGEGYLPNYTVVDQDGNRFKFYDDLIRGKKVIVNFIYTSCSELCPLTTSRMAMLQDRLGDALGRDYFMYTITIDPDHDGKDELKTYSKAFNVKPGWRFLTGSPEEIREINYKLGERAKLRADHRQEIMLGNDAKKSWARDSVLGDLDRLMLTVQEMDPSVNLAKVAGGSLSTTGMSAVSLAPGEALYGRMCASCHTIGHGVRTGPDLKDVALRRDEAWLKSFIQNPDRKFAEKDPIALSLKENFPAVTMPNLGLSARDAEDVLAYIARRSEAASATTASAKPVQQ